jgi:hypothetical protein
MEDPVQAWEQAQKAKDAALSPLGRARSARKQIEEASDGPQTAGLIGRNAVLKRWVVRERPVLGSPKVGVLQPGTGIDVSESIVDAKGRVWVHCAQGWTNAHTADGSKIIGPTGEHSPGDALAGYLPEGSPVEPARNPLAKLDHNPVLVEPDGTGKSAPQTMTPVEGDDGQNDVLKAAVAAVAAAAVAAVNPPNRSNRTGLASGLRGSPRRSRSQSPASSVEGSPALPTDLRAAAAPRTHADKEKSPPERLDTAIDDFLLALGIEGVDGDGGSGGGGSGEVFGGAAQLVEGSPAVETGAGQRDRRSLFAGRRTATRAAVRQELGRRVERSVPRADDNGKDSLAGWGSGSGSDSAAGDGSLLYDSSSSPSEEDEVGSGGDDGSGTGVHHIGQAEARKAPVPRNTRPRKERVQSREERYWEKLQAMQIKLSEAHSARHEATKTADVAERRAVRLEEELLKEQDSARRKHGNSWRLRQDVEQLRKDLAHKSKELEAEFEAHAHFREEAAANRAKAEADWEWKHFSEVQGIVGRVHSEAEEQGAAMQQAWQAAARQVEAGAAAAFVAQCSAIEERLATQQGQLGRLQRTIVRMDDYLGLVNEAMLVAAEEAAQAELEMVESEQLRMMAESTVDGAADACRRSVAEAEAATEAARAAEDDRYRMLAQKDEAQEEVAACRAKVEASDRLADALAEAERRAAEGEAATAELGPLQRALTGLEAELAKRTAELQAVRLGQQVSACTYASMQVRLRLHVCKCVGRSGSRTPCR